MRPAHTRHEATRSGNEQPEDALVPVVRRVGGSASEPWIGPPLPARLLRLTGVREALAALAALRCAVRLFGRLLGRFNLRRSHFERAGLRLEFGACGRVVDGLGQAATPRRLVA